MLFKSLFSSCLILSYVFFFLFSLKIKAIEVGAPIHIVETAKDSGKDEAFSTVESVKRDWRGEMVKRETNLVSTAWPIGTPEAGVHPLTWRKGRYPPHSPC